MLKEKRMKIKVSLIWFGVFVIVFFSGLLNKQIGEETKYIAWLMYWAFLTLYARSLENKS